MEVYNVPEHGHADAYLIEGTESNPNLIGPLTKQFEAMYNEGALEFVVEQGLYYPTATNYGYVCTGLESPGDWDDHQRIFSLDGQDIQYAGVQTESLPYVYYTPSYGYSQSAYNPYNPYIPGAMIGVDGPFIDTQHYYTIPSYENSVSSPAYFPMFVQSHPDNLSISTIEPFMGTEASIPSRGEVPVLKQNLSSASAAFKPNHLRSASSQTNSLTRGSEDSNASSGPGKQPVNPSGFPNVASSHVFHGRGAQVVDTVSHGKGWSNHNQLKVAPPSGNGLSNIGSSAHGRIMVDKVKPKFYAGRALNDVNSSPDALTEQNRGPRITKSKNHLAVKAYTTRAGDSDAQGTIIIYTDQYNKNDFMVDYANAKFFVIKSYSEDDVHKSIKYNIWSSTPNGNKKLNSAYDDAQRIAAGEPRGCPVFLFFSVNASGQFCGVAEMTGPVDFHKDMDFWQQDKWCGSFPVKWHIIKDVPNPNFRHIILENNENKPVTNSRDTQEIRDWKGLEMLKIFKHYTSKTSLLDDFMYYENRQKLLQEEKARLLVKSYNSPFFIPVIDPPRKLTGIHDLPSSEDVKSTKHNIANSSKKNVSTSTNHVSSDNDITIPMVNNTHVADEKAEDGILKIGSLSISPTPVGMKTSVGPKQSRMKTLEAAPAPLAPAPATTTVNTEPANVDVVTVGSMPVKVNGFAKSSGILTVGTIPLDPRVLQLDEAGLSAKNGSA